MASSSAPEPSSSSSMPRIPMTSSTYPPPTPLPRPASRRSASSYQLPTARQASAYHSHRPPQHHRTASSSAVLNFSTRSHPFTSQTTTPPPPPPLQASPSSLVVEPRFSRLFTSVLGSPFLTTSDPPPHLNGVELDMLDSLPVQRPASPSPTADFSMIDVDPDELNADYYANSFIPGAYPYSQTRHGHGRSMSSLSGFGFSRGATFYNNSPGWGPSGFTNSGATGSSPTPRDQYAGPSSAGSSPQNPLKSLLPRLWDVLSSPGRAVLNLSSSTPNNPMSPSSSLPSPRAGSPSTSPRGPTPGSSSWYTSNHNSGRQSPGYWSTPNLNSGKGKSKVKAANFFSNTHTSRNGSRGELSEYINYSELPPLDGEEGELIDDEACFIDVRAVTGIDILGLLPPELALQILMMLCPPPLVSSSSRDKVPLSSASQSEAKSSTTTGLSPRSLPNSSNSSRPFPLALSAADQTAALHDLLACRSVSRTWCRLASDNDVWRVLFLGRWEVDLRRGGKEMRMKMGYHDLNKVRSGTSAREMFGPTWDSTWPSWAAGKNASKNTRPSSGGKTHKFQPLTLSPTVQRPMMTRSRSSAFEHDRSGRVSMNGSIKSNRPIISAPLQLDWRVLYRERLELDKRWSGTARRPDEVNPNLASSISALGGERGLEMQKHDGGKKAFEPQLLRISGHTDSVYCLEFDSRRIITGSRDRTIKVWSLRTGKLLGTFRGVHKGSVLCLKFEKDWDWVDGWDGSDCLDDDQAAGLTQSCSSVRSQGREKREGFMVSGSSDCSVCVWKLEVGDVMSGGEGGNGEEREVKAEMRAVLKGHIGGVLDLRIDGKWIVSCSKDAVIRVWDRQTLELHRTLRGHEGPVNAVGLQSGRVVSASGDGKMILWDIASGERLRTFEGHDRGLACIEFKDDMIVSGSNDCKIKVWCASTGECLQTLVGHEALVRALSFDSRSGHLVSASYDKTVKLWDLRTGKLLREFKGTHTSHIFDVKFDVARIVSTSHDQKIVVLDFSDGLDASLFI